MTRLSNQQARDLGIIPGPQKKKQKKKPQAQPKVQLTVVQWDAKKLPGRILAIGTVCAAVIKRMEELALGEAGKIQGRADQSDQVTEAGI